MDMIINLSIAFIGAVFVSIGWYILQLENGANISILHLYVAAFVFAVIITFMTVPLWPIASIMQWTGKTTKIAVTDLAKFRSIYPLIIWRILLIVANNDQQKSID